MESFRNTLRNKWTKHVTARRIRNLWNEYTKVAEIKDPNLVTLKLNNFLDSFQESYKELLDSGQIKTIDLDKIFGDCSDILVSLLDLVERESNRTIKRGQSAESDEDQDSLKYVVELINKSLGVAELILHISVSEHTEDDLLKLINMRKSLSMSSISEFARHKIGTVVSEGFKVIVGEFQKVFSPHDFETTPRKLSLEKSNIYNGNDMALDDSFIPSFEVIEQEIKSLNNMINGIIENGGLSNSGNRSVTGTGNSNIMNNNNNNNDVNNSSNSNNNNSNNNSNDGEDDDSTVAVSVVADESKRNSIDPTEEEILKEFMRVQGALTLLADSIQEAALVVQLDLLETISKLLYNNQKNQQEFRAMNGYSILIHLFDNVHDFNTPEGKDFLNDCFCLIFAIILDGNKSKRVMNIDALDFLFRILSNSIQTEVRLQTMTCIQDLISINPLNIISIRHVGAIDKLFQLVLDIHGNKENENEDLNDEKESTKLLLATSELILYLGVLFSKHNTEVFRKYVDLMHKSDPPLTDTLQSLMLSSSITLLSDTIYHKTLIEKNLLSVFIDIIQRYQRELKELKNNIDREQLEEDDIDSEYDEKIQTLSEKLLLILELIFMYIKYVDDETTIEFISKPESIKLFVRLAMEDNHYLGGSDVSDLCLWIVVTMMSMDANSYSFATGSSNSSIGVLIAMLDDQSFSMDKKEKLCYCIADVMRLVPPDKMSLKIKFQECGGLNSLVACARNANATQGLVYASLVALCEACHGCEENKCVLDSSGYMALSSVVKSSHVVIDQYLFQMFVELAMNNDVVIRYDIDYLEQIFSPRVNHVIQNIIQPQPQYTSILPYSKRQLVEVASATNNLKKQKQQQQQQQMTLLAGGKPSINIQGEVQQQEQQLYGDEINLGEDLAIDTSPVSSPSTTPVHSLSSSQNGHLQAMQQMTNHSSSHLSLPSMPASMNISHVLQAKTGIVRVPSFRNLFSGTRRNSIGSWAGSFDDLYGVCQATVNSDNMSNFNSNNVLLTEASQIKYYRSQLSVQEDDKETLYSYTLLGRSKLRSPDAALMLVDLLPQSPTHVQQHNLILLMKILESNPQNKKMLCAAQGLKFLLYLSHQSPEETQSYYSRLIVILGLYDISPSEVRLLFDLACFPSFESHPQLLHHHNNNLSSALQQAANNNNNNSNNSNFVNTPSSTHSVQRRERNRKQELQMQVLYVIGTLTERKAPPLYFNFDGFDSYISVGTIDKFPSQRSGYTFSCWLRTNYFLSDEAGLFSWQDTNENNIFDVYFKALGKHPENKRYLCIQTRNYPSPPETFYFDKFGFVECGGWHHIVITHNKQKISLYVDGKFIQNYSTANYPKTITKDKPIQGCIGRRLYSTVAANNNNNSNNNSSSNLSQLISQASQTSFNSLSSMDQETLSSSLREMNGNGYEKGFFCGQMGTIHFFEGIWEAPSCYKVYSRGNLYNNTYKTLGIENKEFLVIKPASSPSNIIEPINTTLSMSGEVFMPPIPIHSPPSSPSIPRNLSFQGQLPLSSLSGNSNNNNNAVGPIASGGSGSSAGNSVNSATSNISPSRDSPFLIFNNPDLITTSPISKDKESSGLNPLVNSSDQILQVPKDESLLKKSMSNLVPNETQGALIEFIGVNVHQTRCLKDVIKEVGGIHLCLPFLDMAPAQQVAGLRILAGLLHKSDSNKAQFRELNGFAILYHLLLRFSPSTANPHPSLNAELTMESFEILFDLLLDGMNNLSDTKQLWSHDYTNGVYEKIHAKSKVLDIVYEEMRKCPSLLENLRSLGGFNIVFSLIEIPNEDIRVTAIKLIGLLIHSNSKAASLFRRNSGFDLLAILLARYPPTLPVCKALTVLMVDGYRFDPKCVPETKQRSSSWISLDFFTRDKSSDSLSTLTQSPTIPALAICKRMIIHDIFKKASKIIRIKEVCIDLEELYVHIMDSVLDYFEKEYVLPTNESADIIVKNLVLYFKTLEDIAVPPDISMRILNTINQLAVHNTSVIRATMKSNGLFDHRDMLIIQLLRCDIKGAIMTFDFECVVDQKAFRETNNGLFNNADHDSGEVEMQQQQHDDLNDPIGCFIDTYYRDDFTPKRIEIETRIAKLMQPVETKFNSQQEKLVKLKEKRIKQRKDKLLKQHSTIQKLLQEVEEKRRACANKMIAQYIAKSKSIPQHSKERLKLGKERWEFFKQKLWDSVLWINEQQQPNNNNTITPTNSINIPPTTTTSSSSSTTANDNSPSKTNITTNEIITTTNENN
ncbi:hypothetical protein PPL_09493 [Heterostelium album PN500]|uniref:DUF4704 domain-containing protein n=1 Tax=Heterostelium pallidum (strain ATCC 26659 / Pp 5 / PN500) TaxID=670386 RepID=D3BN82_HETP5|nr:hypothetical protein PPL_09493 [Heterostelium album PN500]EFA76742.1 hypothetical protein PPL_09493 [Heterostelium album PN500]|eukprot:XP_020428874.1 hypothetical protein PPL_09493 [Heterostelium album PN500]